MPFGSRVAAPDVVLFTPCIPSLGLMMLPYDQVQDMCYYIPKMMRPRFATMMAEVDLTPCFVSLLLRSPDEG